MTIVKHSKDSTLLRARKRHFYLEIKNMIPALLLASLLGTYLDLFFVGVNMYTFPMRIFPDVFSINILFTLIGLPVLVIFFLFVMKRLKTLGKMSFIFSISLLMACGEKFAEEIGFLIHDEAWSHWFSFCGYIAFLIGVYLFYRKSSHCLK